MYQMYVDTKKEYKYINGPYLVPIVHGFLSLELDGSA
jgi:hypothetical protein